MEMNFCDSFSTDVLVVGGGLAGIKAALECARSGLQVTLVIKKKICSGSSFYPLTETIGCLAPKDEEDKMILLAELEENGAGLSDRHLSEIYINEIQDRIRELPEMGIAYKSLKGKMACFAKKEHEIVCWFDWGKIRENVVDIFSEMDNVKIMEFCDVLHLIKRNGKIAGAIAVDFKSQLYHIKTNQIILATGGYGGLYKHSLNTEDTIGLGQIMALDAGAKLVNIEFIQFIPGMIKPVYKALFSEQTLQYVEAILDDDGNDLLCQYLPDGITPEQCLLSRSGHGPFTSRDDSKYFDLAMMKEALKTGSQMGYRLVYSPSIYETDNAFLKIHLALLKRLHINLLTDGITIGAFGHAANGGVFIDEHCETGVDGLFAAGEVAGGLHGADRLGGMASGTCLVFGKRAADSAIRHNRSAHCTEYAEDSEAMRQFEGMMDNGMAGVLSPDEVMVEIRRTLWTYANVIRTEKTLDEGLSIVSNLETSYNASSVIVSGSDVREAVKARHCLKLARLLLEVMKERKESRGSHYRDDYPEIDNANFNRRLFVQDSGRSFNLDFQ